MAVVQMVSSLTGSGVGEKVGVGTTGVSVTLICVGDADEVWHAERDNH